MRRQLAAMAHELYQPLNAIKLVAQGRLRELQRGASDPTELMTDFNEILEQVALAAEIVGELRSSQRRPGYRMVSLDVNAELEHVLRQSEARASAKGLALQLVADLRPVPPVAASPGSVKRTVMNLVQNSCDALLTASANTAPTALIWLSSSATADGMVEIRVRDNAGGIPPEVAERMFEPFFTTKKGHGMGMGLAICKHLVESCQGELTFRVEPGKGTTFTLLLPASSEAGFAGSRR